MKALGTAVLLAALAGCSVIQAPPVPTAEPAPLMSAQPQPMVARGTAGGVYAAGRTSSLTADTRALRAGDVVTVVLMETTQASKKADTSFGKDSSFGLNLSSKGKGVDASAGTQRGFDGNASSSQQNTLQGAITVVVQDVLPNGLLRVAGDKSLYLNQGEEVIRLSGYVRAADVDAENRVSSQRIANARIVYSGQGTLADANTPGWLTRFFTSPLMPL